MVNTQSREKSTLTIIFWMNMWEKSHVKGVKSCLKILESILHQLLMIKKLKWN